MNTTMVICRPSQPEYGPQFKSRSVETLVNDGNLNKSQNKVKNKMNNRRGLRRNKTSKFIYNLSFYGVNSAGLLSKLPCFNNVLKSLMPTVFVIEETKLKNNVGLKLKKLKSIKYLS